MNDQEFEQVLAKYRDEPAPILEFHPYVEHLLDSGYCKHLDRIIHESEARWERRKAVDNLGASLPDVKGIYMFVWTPDFCFRFDTQPTSERTNWVQYVGKAGTQTGTHDTIKNRYIDEYHKYVGKDPSGLWSREPAVTREERLSRYLTLRHRAKRSHICRTRRISPSPSV
jgi:hypothetical protein